MPANLYGPGDNYHLENSHVIPALIRDSMRRKKVRRRKRQYGAPVRRAVNSCSLTTWLRRACM